MLIDSHIHIFPDPLAPKVIPKLAAVSGYDNQTDGTLSSTLEKMREWGVDKGVFLNIATKPSQQKSINDFCASIASDTVIPFGSVHPDAPDWEAELERILAHMGGMRLWDDVERWLVGAPVWLDTACCAGQIDPIQLERIIKAHGADKILFASDCPWSDPRTEKVMIEALDLSDSEQEAIFSGNISRPLRL